MACRPVPTASGASPRCIRIRHPEGSPPRRLAGRDEQTTPAASRSFSWIVQFSFSRTVPVAPAPAGFAMAPALHGLFSSAQAWVFEHEVDRLPELVVVDDDADLRELLALILTAEGHHVRLADSGATGLVLLEHLAPDLLVMDVDMPGLGGRAVAREIRQRDRGLERIPIVLISGAMDLGVVATDVGTPYFLAKPCGLIDVVAIVERALRERLAPAPSSEEEQR
jgi:CheY-like chemotaxis protein